MPMAVVVAARIMPGPAQNRLVRRRAADGLRGADARRIAIEWELAIPALNLLILNQLRCEALRQRTVGFRLGFGTGQRGLRLALGLGFEGVGMARGLGDILLGFDLGLLELELLLL